MSGNEIKYINEAFKTNWVVPLGPNVDAFEEDLSQWINKKSYQPVNVVALSSGTAAIHLALVMAGVQKDDVVICQSFTFAASANPILYQGAIPIFVDSEKDTWNMDPQLLEKAINDTLQKKKKLPKAIILVHLYGTPGKIYEIIKIANKFNIPVIEDAAEAMGSEYDRQYCGIFGKFGILSFNGNKMITTSGGGALICHSEEESLRVKFYATQARENFPYYQHEKIGYNYRLSNISAGIGRGQMTIVDEHIVHRREMHNLYVNELDDIYGIEVNKPYSKIPINPNYWLSTALINPAKTSFSCQELSDYLSRLNIESRRVWKPLHMQPVFRDCEKLVNSVSEHIFDNGICLPSGPLVTEEDIHFIVSGIKKFSLQKRKVFIKEDIVFDNILK